MVLFLVPETLPYFVFEKTLSKKLEKNIKNSFPKPIFLESWKRLTFLAIPNLLIITLASGFDLCSLYKLIIILPIELADFWNLDQLIIGICYLPFGVGAMIGSIIGGRVTDWMTARFKCKEGDLLSTIIGLISMLPGIVVVFFLILCFIILKGSGWILQTHSSLGILLVFTSLVGFGLTWSMTGVLTFAIMTKPYAAADIIGSVQFGQFVLSELGIFAGANLSETCNNIRQ